jgi:hypothetical protein
MSDQKLPTPQERQADDPFDRRQAGNSSVQWVRDAFKEQNAKIDHLSDVVHEISTDLKKSWRGERPENHWDEHELFKEREKERQRLEAQREVERAERAEFIKNLKKEALSWGIKAFAVFVLGVFALGGEEQFKRAVRWAVSSDNAQEVKK